MQYATKPKFKFNAQELQLPRCMVKVSHSHTNHSHSHSHSYIYHAPLVDLNLKGEVQGTNLKLSSKTPYYLVVAESSLKLTSCCGQMWARLTCGDQCTFPIEIIGVLSHSWFNLVQTPPCEDPESLVLMNTAGKPALTGRWIYPLIVYNDRCVHAGESTRP